MKRQETHGPEIAATASARQGDQFQRDLLALAPHLRAFSRALCSRRDFAEDLAQEALMKAWRARASFEAGTNLKAWLFTILRNCFYSHGRRAWREAHWDSAAAERIEGPPNKQDWAIELSDTARALRTLPDAQREAVILVGAGGFSYEEAAEICDSAIGTIKSRVARGRTALLSVLGGSEPLPQLASNGKTDASDDILGQLNVLAATATTRAAQL
jgi:RNA polymerase sigma-70 factor (ECF subfamily)